MLTSACMLFLAIATTLIAADPPPASVTQVQRAEALDDVGKVGTELQKLGDWDDQYLIIHDAISNVFEQNGWKSEEHRFARDLANRVAQIPPWEFDKRLGALADGLGDRFDLSSAERYQLRGTIMRESLGLIWNNRAALMRNVQEQVELRSRGEAFTPEEVARWVRDGRPLLDEANERIERLYSQIGEMTDEEHRALLERDMQSFYERKKVVERMAERWAGGQWSPEEWGLQNDPIHQRAALDQAKMEQAKLDAERSVHGIALSYDPTTWPFLVSERARRYEFDRSQLNAAESILVELQERAVTFLSARWAALEEVPVSQRETHESYADVRTMFEELADRVDRLATAAQRNIAANPPSTRAAETTGNAND